MTDLDEMAETFFREGCVLVPGALAPELVDALRQKTDECAADPTIDKRHLSWVGDTFVLRRCQEIDAIFDELTRHPEIFRCAEAILGNGAAFNAMNVIRNGTGQAISRWHVDDTLEFPLPPDIPRFDARLRMPVLWLTVQVALSDIDGIENGPTQFVPGSHYSGRYPPEGKEEPQFEGYPPYAMLCKAGDIYLFNHQTWHRGAPNTSERTRYVLQIQYAKRWANARFRGLA